MLSSELEFALIIKSVMCLNSLIRVLPCCTCCKHLLIPLLGLSEFFGEGCLALFLHLGQSISKHLLLWGQRCLDGRASTSFSRWCFSSPGQTLMFCCWGARLQCWFGSKGIFHGTSRRFKLVDWFLIFKDNFWRYHSRRFLVSVHLGSSLRSRTVVDYVYIYLYCLNLDWGFNLVFSSREGVFFFSPWCWRWRSS